MDPISPCLPKIATNADLKQDDNTILRRGRFYFCAKLAQTILVYPATEGALLALRTVKLLTYAPVKAGLYKISGYHTKASTYFQKEYLKTMQVVRNIGLIPSLAKRTFKDIIAKDEQFKDDITQKTPEEYLNVKVKFNRSPQYFSNYLHGGRTCDVISPIGITEFAATTDAELKTIMASHLFKADTLAINFGCPNVATFINKAQEDRSIETFKVDAKSAYREPMAYHATHGKIQSGVFLVPTNLPHEVLERFEEAAQKLQNSRDITCVNTNCQVLKAAGFSIEGVDMEDIIFPNKLIEHFLFRNVFYTDLNGDKHKVHFNIVNTTPDTLNEFFEKVDMAVISTRYRHKLRKNDTEEKQKARGEAAKAIIAKEAKRIAATESTQPLNEEDLKQRKMTISVPSFVGDLFTRIWGRHTLYELDLTDQQVEITQAFQDLANKNDQDKTVKLHPFPQKKPSLVTRLKKNIFFSGPMIRLLRRHMMGRVDKIYLRTQDIFQYIKSNKDAHLNYVLLDDKIVIAKVNVNDEKAKGHAKTADWALSKHALLSGRQDVYCSGEMWYDEANGRFMMDGNSGTYVPTAARVKTVVTLANKIFNAQGTKNIFEAVETKEAVV